MSSASGSVFVNLATTVWNSVLPKPECCKHVKVGSAISKFSHPTATIHIVLNSLTHKKMISFTTVQKSTLAHFFTYWLV